MTGNEREVFVSAACQGPKRLALLRGDVHHGVDSRSVGTLRGKGAPPDSATGVSSNRRQPQPSVGPTEVCRSLVISPAARIVVRAHDGRYRGLVPAWASAITRRRGSGGECPQIRSPPNRRRHPFQWRGLRTIWYRRHSISEACGMVAVDLDSLSGGPSARRPSDNTMVETQPASAQCSERPSRPQSRHRSPRRVGAGSPSHMDWAFAPAYAMYGVATPKSPRKARTDRYPITQCHRSDVWPVWNGDTVHSPRMLRCKCSMRRLRTSGVRRVKPHWRAVCRGTCNPLLCADLGAPTVGCRYGRPTIPADGLRTPRRLPVGFERKEASVQTVSASLTTMSVLSLERQPYAYVILMFTQQTVSSRRKKPGAKLETSTPFQAADTVRKTKKRRCENARPDIQTKTRDFTLGTKFSPSTSYCRVHLHTTLHVKATNRVQLLGNRRDK